MADPEIEEAQETKKSSKLPLILGLALGIAGGGAGFYAAYSGMILGGSSSKEVAEATSETTYALESETTFVPMEPLTISLGSNSVNQHLRFRAELEVPAKYSAEVKKVMPRLVDVLNSYLRAVEIRDLEDPSALTRLRAQMLRRLQVVAGPEKVDDLLVMEFVLN